MTTRSEFELGCIAIAAQRQQQVAAPSSWWRVSTQYPCAPCALELRVSHVVTAYNNSHGTPMEHESATPAVYWEDDDDSDDERCQPSSSMKPSALPCGGGSGEDVVALDLVYVVVWSEPYQCPIIYFTAAALPLEDVGEGSKEQQRKGHGVRPFRPTVQQLKQWVMPGISDPLTSSSSIGGGDEVVSYAGPIVSEGFSEELQRAMFSVHPCDMSSMLQIANDALGDPTSHTSQHATTLVRLLRMCGPALGIPSVCLPI